MARLPASAGKPPGSPWPSSPWHWAQCCSYTLLPRAMALAGGAATVAGTLRSCCGRPCRYTAIARASASLRYCVLRNTTSAMGPSTDPCGATPVFSKAITSSVFHSLTPASCAALSAGAYQFCTGISPPVKALASVVAPNALRLVGCEVGAVHHAKRRLDAAPPRIGCPALRGVAGHAVAGAGQVFATLNQFSCALQRLASGQRLLAAQVQADQQCCRDAQGSQNGRDCPEDAFHRCIPSQCAAAAATGTSATPPQRAGIAAGKVRAGLPPAATGWAANQAETALTSSGVSWRAMSAMQSGRCARRWPVFQAPSWLLR